MNLDQFQKKSENNFWYSFSIYNLHLNFKMFFLVIIFQVCSNFGKVVHLMINFETWVSQFHLKYDTFKVILWQMWKSPFMRGFSLNFKDHFKIPILESIFTLFLWNWQLVAWNSQEFFYFFCETEAESLFLWSESFTFFAENDNCRRKNI